MKCNKAFEEANKAIQTIQQTIDQASTAYEWYEKTLLAKCNSLEYEELYKNYLSLYNQSNMNFKNALKFLNRFNKQELNKFNLSDRVILKEKLRICEKNIKLLMKKPLIRKITGGGQVGNYTN